jgi:hypothetical protein
MNGALLTKADSSTKLIQRGLPDVREFSTHASLLNPRYVSIRHQHNARKVAQMVADYLIEMAI